MFSDKTANYNMIEGAYKKLKSYYHYNKNFLFMRKKVAEFESSQENMENSLSLLSDIMLNPELFEEEISIWIEKIKYYVLPKSFQEEDSIDEKFIVNDTQTDKFINKVNFFIDMPIELHLLETVWTLFVGKLVFDNGIISKNCYGNRLDNYVIYNRESEFKKSINFQKNKLFKIYFGQYCNWKNNAIETIDRNKKDKSMIMISLDVKEYFYSVIWTFNLLSDILQDKRYKEISSLTQIIERIFLRYTAIISEVRDISQDVHKRESMLPIGLFSSMLLANVYLADIDKLVGLSENVLYYGRYVDDILIIVDVSEKKFESNEKCLNELLINQMKILRNAGGDSYCLDAHSELLIQKEKLKVMFFRCGKSNSLIKQLKKTKIVPSQMNVVPENELKMADFEEAAYVIQNFTTETKFRDFGQLEVNRFKLSWHMAELVRSSKYKSKQLSIKEKVNRQIESEQILLFFRGSNALEYSSNWINVLYYFMLLNDLNKNAWKQFESNIRNAIKQLKFKPTEAIRTGKMNTLKTIMKKQLLEQLNICIATALALNPRFYKKESQEAKILACQLRKANLFNHYLVAYPLINYMDGVDEEIDLTMISIEQLRHYSFNILKSRKMQYTPRFINLDELFQFAFLESITHDNTWHINEQRIEFIRNVFFKINRIDNIFASPLQIEIKNVEKPGNYYVQEINLKGQEYNLGKIRIAVANISLGIKECCMGIERYEILRNRTDFISFLREAYENENGKVDFLLFPEFYLPMQWISDVLSYVRKSGITVITGLQYITRENQAHNTIGVFTQICSGKYKNSCMIIREKNDYAPFEKKLLALKGYCCNDRVKPVYSIINCNGVSFGTFLCYEFTDIVARSLYKDRVDMLFISENNRDTTYFSNIIETMTRDLHTFVVQSNTSIYGDSRISGPYSRDQRNIVQIKGGDNNSIIIGTVDIKAIGKAREKERVQMEKDIKSYLEMDSKHKFAIEKELIKKQEMKISKMSARTKH